MVDIKDLVVGGNARTFNTATGHDISGKPTGQGFGAARKGPSVKGKKESLLSTSDKRTK